jgi:hypothetical protein
MRKLEVLGVIIIAAIVMLAGCGKGSGPAVNGDEVVVATDQLDVHFSRGEPFSETYMIFGGMHTNHKNAINEITISALSMEDAVPIYAKYPDFDKCASPGAARAKKAIYQMNIVSSDSGVLKVLKKALSEHTRSLKRGGDRVCVRLEGAWLEMMAATVREVNEDIIDELPPQARTDYCLVESAEIVEAMTALEGG